MKFPLDRVTALFGWSAALLASAFAVLPDTGLPSKIALYLFGGPALILSILMLARLLPLRRLRPVLAADVVLFADDNLGSRYILLIQRGTDPCKGCWALPGGRVDPGETFEQAARRELTEETGLTAPATLHQAGVWDAVDRDLRGRVISVAFTGCLDAAYNPVAASDAGAAQWVAVDTLGRYPLAFDHHAIIAAARAIPAPSGIAGSPADRD